MRLLPYCEIEGCEQVAKMKLLPYCYIDGVPTLTDSEIMSLYQRTEKEGTRKTVFCDGVINSKEKFLKKMKHGQNNLYLIMEKTIKGFVWLNRHENKFARIHFCFFREAWGKTVELGKFVSDALINMKSNGEFIIDLLLGYVAISNIKAISFVRKIGCVEVGEIPYGVWNKYTNKSEPTKIFYYVRAT